jgi:drug/metabolite transporter (DMT)-like permease
MKLFFKTYWTYFVSFIIPVIIMTGVYLSQGIYWNSETSPLLGDGFHQYVIFNVSQSHLAFYYTLRGNFMKKNTLRHSLLLLLTAAIWGFAFVAQSVGMDYVQPFTFTAARSLIGGIVLLPFIFIRAQKTGRTSEEKSASWKQALPGGIICGVLLCIASNLQQIGIQYTTVGKSGFITAMYIVLVPVLGILFHKKTGIRVWISVALAVCGLYLLCMTGGSFRLQRGDLYTLCCALMFSLQILAVDHYAPIADNAILACIEFFTCGICSLIPMFLLEQPRMHLILAAWLPILYAGILSNGVAYTLQFFAQRGLPASTASLLMSTESVFSLLAGFLILHQMLNGRELAGCALMFAAIILVQIKGKEKESINS